MAALVAAFLALLCVTTLASTANGDPTGAPAGQGLVERARALGIGRSLAWRRILHARAGSPNAPSSEVDGPEFFLSAQGRDDPEAELEATLVAFQIPVRAGAEDAHPLCRFPARRHLLDQRLHFEGALRSPHCPALEAFVADMDPESVAIVYSANYINNPASAFGHTFLRVHKRPGIDSHEPDEQRDHGIDFLARTDTHNPFLYAFKGIGGLFPGYFQFHSFEEKAREYGNLEARDLWEYDLALTPDEVTLLVLHLWELKATHIRYYYLTRNCSYEILGVVEAAAPRLELISQLKFVVLPKDTVKALYAIPGLVREVGYRPSLRSRFRARVGDLDGEQRGLVERLTLDPSTPLPADLSTPRAVATLDEAVFVFDARFATRLEVERDPRLIAARARLIDRRLSLSSPLPPPATTPAPLAEAPDRGAGVMRATIGSGATTQYGSGYATLGYRIALHDLADPPEGEPKLSQLQFLDTRLRYDAGRRHLSLERLTFAEVVALNPLSRYEKDISWSIRAFGTRLHDAGCPDCFAHGLDLALGATVATNDERVAFFLMGEAYVAFSGSVDGIGGSFVRAGTGPYAGLRVRLPDDTIALVTSTFSYLPAQHLHTTFDVRASLRRPLARNVALGFEGVAQPLSCQGELDSYFYF